MLRHSRTLRCNVRGSVWLQDLIDAMRIGDHGLSASIAQIAYAVARDQNGRFQLAQQDNRSPHDGRHFVIRAVQGHSRYMLEQMNEGVAHTLVTYELDISHATYSQVLSQIIGIGALGLLSGGHAATGTSIVPA